MFRFVLQEVPFHNKELKTSQQRTKTFQQGITLRHLNMFLSSRSSTFENKQYDCTQTTRNIDNVLYDNKQQQQQQKHAKSCLTKKPPTKTNVNSHSFFISRAAIIVVVVIILITIIITITIIIIVVVVVVIIIIVIIINTLDKCNINTIQNI